MHHEKLGIPRWAELAIEGILEFFYFMFFPVIFQATYKDWIIPFSVIVLLSMAYTSYHIYNYSILGSKDHQRHHMNPETNYSPNFLDHLFDTNFNEEHEDLNPGIVNVIACTLATLYLKRFFGWTDRVY
jgi:glucan phosphoethanolaminetransferase (alkaline phosphatase superfamily)